MTYFLRTIEALFYPIGLIWVSMTISAIVLWRKKQRGVAFVCGLFGVFLYAIGALPIPELLMARLERPFVERTVANAEKADAVIVLGGMMNPSRHETFGFSLSPAADRLMTGIEILRQKKAGALIIGGGVMGRENRTSEGERLAEFVKTWNVTPGEVIGLAGCLNTHEEALRARQVTTERGWTNLILVTSAYHMPRALATFSKAGLNVRAVACDFEALPVLEGDVAGFRLVPIIDHVQNFTLYMHEVIGWYYYWLRGWI
jgi:uncharacterized SAM-binding protein YcdF (DUF218 family)